MKKIKLILKKLDESIRMYQVKILAREATSLVRARKPEKCTNIQRKEFL